MPPKEHTAAAPGICVPLPRRATMHMFNYAARVVNHGVPGSYLRMVSMRDVSVEVNSLIRL